MTNARCFGMLCVTVLLLAVTPSFADSFTGFEGTITAGGIDFDAKLVVNNAGFDLNTLTCTVANCSYSLVFSGKNTNGTTSTLNAFAVQIFGDGQNASFDLSGGYSIPPNWVAVAGAKIDNGNPGLGCNPSNGAAGWICGSALTMADVLKIGSGQTFSTNFAGLFQNGTSVLSAFDLMAHGLTNVDDLNSKWAISQGFDWHMIQIPEPSGLSVIASGLLSAGILLRRKLLV
jgi:hypothetical protein